MLIITQLFLHIHIGNTSNIICAKFHEKNCYYYKVISQYIRCLFHTPARKYWMKKWVYEGQSNLQTSMPLEEVDWLTRLRVNAVVVRVLVVGSAYSFISIRLLSALSRSSNYVILDEHVRVRRPVFCLHFHLRCTLALAHMACLARPPCMHLSCRHALHKSRHAPAIGDATPRRGTWHCVHTSQSATHNLCA